MTGLIAANGVLAVHISNRYLDLEPVVAALVRDAAHVARMRVDRGLTTEQERLGYTGSVWVVVARRVEDLGAIATDSKWTPLRRGSRRLDRRLFQSPAGTEKGLRRASPFRFHACPLPRDP